MILMIGLTCSMSCITVTDIERRVAAHSKLFSERDLSSERFVYRERRSSERERLSEHAMGILCI